MLIRNKYKRVGTDIELSCKMKHEIYLNYFAIIQLRNLQSVFVFVPQFSKSLICVVSIKQISTCRSSFEKYTVTQIKGNRNIMRDKLIYNFKIYRKTWNVEVGEKVFHHDEASLR